MNKISKVRVLPEDRLDLEFEDGLSGTVDLFENVGKGVFALWPTRSFLSRLLSVHPANWFWGEKIDLCPDTLYLK
jgi:hypothetical protein